MMRMMINDVGPGVQWITEQSRRPKLSLDYVVPGLVRQTSDTGHHVRGEVGDDGGHGPHLVSSLALRVCEAVRVTLPASQL